MPDRKAPSPRNPSRTAAKIAVVVLIVIAIAGFVLAGLRSAKTRPDQAAAADATQQPASPLTAKQAPANAAPVAAAAPADEDAAGPNQLIFVPSSDRLTQRAAEKVVKLAETARADRRMVSIASRIARSDEKDRMDLARKRSDAIRDLLEANGVPRRNVRIEIAELPPALVSPADVNRIQLLLR
jgi:outer membrane protein OmpA-like peptidoglycan-associated protein